MVSFSVFDHKVERYHFKVVEPISADYRVLVNGKEAPVYTCRISAHPFNRFFPGYQRSIDQTEKASFVNIVSDETVDIQVKCNRGFKRVSVRPRSYDIGVKTEGADSFFSLAPNQSVVFMGEDYHNCLFLFNSLPIEAPSKESVTHYFGAGIHFAGKIVLKDNESVYVDKDALVFGSVFAENAKNVSVFGNGIFDDSCEARFTRAGYESYVNGNAKFFDCENVKVQGVLFRDSPIWCVNFFHCKNVDVDNIKVFGQWRYNTDGVDIVNSSNVKVKNSFIHSFDDTVVIKGIDRYFDFDNENILIDNCVLWCDWGKTCEIGVETSCRRYKNIKFSNCDILRAGNTALDIQNGDFAEVFDISYENINVELNSFDEVPVYQKNDSMVYDTCGKQMIAKAISIKNHRYRQELWGGQYKLPEEFDLSGVESASVHDVKFKNIKVNYDSGFKTEIGYGNLVEIASSLENVRFYNIDIEDLYINGEKYDCAK